MERKASTARSDLEQVLIDETVEPKALPLSLLEDITDNFSDDRGIGSGGFAVVYKGILGDGMVVVKRLSDAFMDGAQFHREVECLMRVLESWSDRLERSQRDTLCEQIRVCYKAALQCTDFNPEKRPSSARNIFDRLLHEMESIQINSKFRPLTSSSTVKKKLHKNAIGFLEVEILGARNLVAMEIKEGRLTDPYCVINYGEKWVRTGTLFATAAPLWNEQYTWNVFDVSTVINVAVFDDCHLSPGSHDARDQQMGKVRIPLTTLETDRRYTQYYPLMALTPSGLKKTGELHLAVRFTCKSWAKMLAMYGKPMLPNIHYTNPISALWQEPDYLWSVQQVDLWSHEVQMVAKRLERAQPPLRREVVSTCSTSTLTCSACAGARPTSTGSTRSSPAPSPSLNGSMASASGRAQ